jgi:DNA-binding transcriptional regulator LsrR (DeoR family)
MSRPQLARARVVAVAGGAAKRAAIRGALRSGLVDTLVTDPATAAALVERA